MNICKKGRRLEIASKRRFLFLEIISDIALSFPVKVHVRERFRALFVINSGTSCRSVARRENLSWHDVDIFFSDLEVIGDFPHCVNNGRCLLL